MKTLTFILFWSLMLFAQPDHPGELIINLTNRGSSWNVTLQLSSISAKWDENFELTDEYNFPSVQLVSPWDIEAYYDNVRDVLAGDHPIFALGLYKISAIENGVERAYFFMDWRSSADEMHDVYFDYDVSNSRFTYRYGSTSINYTYQTIWDLTITLLETSGLESYWSNALAVTNDANNHPRLVWGPYPDDIGITNYRIYKTVGSGQPQLLTTVSSSVYLYTDGTITISQIAGTDVYYYVKGVYFEGSYIETSASNTVSVNTRNQGENKINIGSKKFDDLTFSLSQNYPNPFNPSTNITWQIPVDDFVTLKVFDLLGREVASLVNEYKIAGEYSVEFIASELPSGVYLYKIQCGNYVATRKLILQK